MKHEKRRRKEQPNILSIEKKKTKTKVGNEIYYKKKKK